ncbi:hypothetical protein F5J12DRAFT_902166 [Pisolithus orientalis]|uniref:uncharacterized protein n=1 Tax=Pisolithus orientalis TaxID=936130 RepID=UPI0022249280|nr:uncharacterized protein F5J12DRAFT_902166 [Pisolithus orientalis]KAI6035342.1 hypothetical protein F5J12DRAFT_902166 [Pisolithus orientalis]
MAESVEEYLAVLKVAYDYEPQSEDEVAIKENQIVFLLEKTDDDWWKVRSRSDSQSGEAPSGLVPAAYVEPAPHTFVVKALYDYDASAPGELSIKEDEHLLVFDREDDWILVQSQKEGGRAGFVPGNYVEEYSGEEQEPPSRTSADSVSSRPASVYVDPADLVAQTSVKAQADDIKTWAVSEVDGKGKKKKGTLGIGNGSIFFASESDKTPVRQWKTADVEDVTIEKQKHLLINIGGVGPTRLHFAVGSKQISDAIIDKLESSKGIHTAAIAEGRAGTLTPPARNVETASPSKKNGVSVRFTDESPEIIPPRESSEEGEEEIAEGESAIEEGDVTGELAVVLYDFQGTSVDELSAQEGEQLWIIEKEGAEWWKCRNEEGLEGVVPASYLEEARPRVEPEERDHEPLAKETQKRLESEHRKASRARVEEEQRRAAAAETKREAEADKKRREMEVTAAEFQRKRRQEAARHGPPPESTRTWHDRTGQFRVDAALLGYSNGKLRLHKVNGVIIEVPSEKMSLEDIRYVEKLTSKKSSGAVSRSAVDDDDQPLALKRQTEAVNRAPTQTKRGPQVDWFEFFLSAGCEVDDCTRYASAFERDKIDEVILPDITESTMRSLGLREGDIIRVSKVIQQKYKKPVQEQISRDEELTRKLQEEENGKKSSTPSPASNLFSGPGGRRGRPQPSRSLPPTNVEMGAIGSASEQIKRTGSPLVTTNSPTLVAPERPGSAATPANSGFDDDAWTNRPGAKSSASATAPPTAARAPSAPPTTQPLTTAPSPPASALEARSQESQLKTERAVPSPSPAQATAATAAPLPPHGYSSGLGVGSSPLPLSQHLQNQQSGVYTPQRDSPRGPFAPVPANQGLLQPLIPTTTGFNSFVPTRAASVPAQPSLHPQITGFPGPSQPLVSQMTSFPASGPIITQPTGAPAGAFSTFTVFCHSHAPPRFNSVMSTPPPAATMAYSQPPNSSNPSTSPANIFAQMKSGTFATDSDHSAPQQPEKYDSLRVNAHANFVPQPTGWGYQPTNGYAGGYMGY